VGKQTLHLQYSTGCPRGDWDCVASVSARLGLAPKLDFDMHQLTCPALAE
jgi:hypothetical protein